VVCLSFPPRQKAHPTMPRRKKAARPKLARRSSASARAAPLGTPLREPLRKHLADHDAAKVSKTRARKPATADAPKTPRLRALREDSVARLVGDVTPLRGTARVAPLPAANPQSTKSISTAKPCGR
jgi:hypothetical protein